MRHQLGSDFGGEFCIKAPANVDGRHLGMLVLGLGSQLLAFPIQVGALGIGL